MSATAKHTVATEVNDDGIFVKLSKQALRTLAALEKPPGRREKRVIRHYGEEFHIDVELDRDRHPLPA